MEPVTVRKSIISDVNDLLSIMKHEEVAKWQFPNPKNYEKILAQTIGGAIYCVAGHQHHYYTIEYESKIVGYIKYSIEGPLVEKAALLGFDLHPDYWGKGVMSKALTLHLPAFTEEYSITIFFASCFNSNKRCRNLLKRHHFFKHPFSLTQYLKNQINGIRHYVTYQKNIDT